MTLPPSSPADRDLGNVLQLPDSGVRVVIGDVGAGKTLAVWRLFQQAIGRAHADSSHPFPLFVNARDLQGSLSDYIDEKSTSLFDPAVQKSLLIVDGLDEIGVTRANRVLERNKSIRRCELEIRRGCDKQNPTGLAVRR